MNVGKAKRVPMAEFRAMLAELGHTGVATLLNSGNAVFQSAGRSADQHATAIATAITDRLGIDVPVIVKTAREFDTIVAENPIEADANQHSRLLVAFVQDPGALPRLGALEPLVTAAERFAIGKTAAYLFCPGGILESKAGAALLGTVGRSATTRNWSTALKLQALAAKSEG